MLDTFFNYIINNYIEDDTPKGDLARDMKKFSEYLVRNDIPLYAFETTLQECWNEYTDTTSETS